MSVLDSLLKITFEDEKTSTMFLFFFLFLAVHGLGQSLFGMCEIEATRHKFRSRLSRWTAVGRSHRRGDSGQSEGFNTKAKNTTANGKSKNVQSNSFHRICEQFID